LIGLNRFSQLVIASPHPFGGEAIQESNGMAFVCGPWIAALASLARNDELSGLRKSDQKMV